ncbi:MAG TPA: ankyrin repeat domain-containing protein [Chthoniobacteraceae bacterium]|jgi:cytochrome c|nr:ankyrin repeat domain-containing protein [Chthoniobacteraceae bacterium]
MAFWNKHKEPEREFQALHEAADVGDVEAVKRIIGEGAKIDELNYLGAPPLQYAVARGYIEIARILVDNGADVNFRIEKGGTPLMGAATCLKPRSIEFLLSQRADPNKKGIDGLFPLACPFQPAVAAVDKQIECIRLLISAGARINERTDSGFTPLMKAAWFGNTQAAEELLRLGADPGLQDIRGRTAAAVASERSHDGLAKLLNDASNG